MKAEATKSPDGCWNPSDDISKNVAGRHSEVMRLNFQSRNLKEMHVGLASLRAASSFFQMPLGAEWWRALHIFIDEFLKGILALAGIEALPHKAIDDFVAQPIQNLAAIRAPGVDASDHLPEQQAGNVVP
ncbi:hypothetical protein OEG86_25370 [Hoeflea alexandrii]|uniref:hypothetical protein n=1 Tax=Hoeflea alexandrii TaxID=288436 RepID=UPI0022703893|nr:hypothetical protein [Hoeflea alexandrii]MCY0154991.1 hypothetical protein [Hoeflea alexandrii]